MQERVSCYLTSLGNGEGRDSFLEVQGEMYIFVNNKFNNRMKQNYNDIEKRLKHLENFTVSLVWMIAFMSIALLLSVWFR